ncbi:unnamed protein product, partial [Nesidiocoris tenuis]
FALKDLTAIIACSLATAPTTISSATRLTDADASEASPAKTATYLFRNASKLSKNRLALDR